MGACHRGSQREAGQGQQPGHALQQGRADVVLGPEAVGERKRVAAGQPAGQQGHAGDQQQAEGDGGRGHDRGEPVHAR
jgi:hypothetical protein